MKKISEYMNIKKAAEFLGERRNKTIKIRINMEKDDNILMYEIFEKHLKETSIWATDNFAQRIHFAAEHTCAEMCNILHDEKRKFRHKKGGHCCFFIPPCFHCDECKKSTQAYIGAYFFNARNSTGGVCQCNECKKQIG